MDWSKSRFVVRWAGAELRARVWFRIWVTTAALCALSLVGNIKAWTKPRDVYRVGCDGVPQLMSLGDTTYSDPSELEIRAFSKEMAVLLMRQDSFSLRHDWEHVAGWMETKLEQQFELEAFGNGSRGNPGLVPALETLQQRTQVDSSALEVEVDKGPYPWRASVKGARQIVAGGPKVSQPFQVELELVRTPRTDTRPQGLLIWKIHTAGDSVAAPERERPREDPREDPRQEVR